MLLTNDHSIIQRREETRAARARAQREAAKARAEKAARRKAQAAASGLEDTSAIEHFNERHTIAELLGRCGYEQAGGSNDWRSPYQTTRGSYATRDFGDYWVSMSGSDAAAEIGAPTQDGYRWGDSFDLYRHFEHAGDFTAAVRAYAEEAGLNGHAYVWPEMDTSWAEQTYAGEANGTPDKEDDMNANTAGSTGENRTNGTNGAGDTGATGEKKANGHAGTWPAPDMSLLSPERPPAPEFPGEDVFGSTWHHWITTSATSKSSPPDYVAAGLLSTASSLIGNARWAAPWEGWSEPPVIWSMLVGHRRLGSLLGWMPP